MTLTVTFILKIANLDFTVAGGINASHKHILFICGGVEIAGQLQNTITGFWVEVIPLA